MCGYHKIKRETEQLDQGIMIPKEVWKLGRTTAPKKMKFNSDKYFSTLWIKQNLPVTLNNQILEDNRISEPAKMD